MQRSLEAYLNCERCLFVCNLLSLNSHMISFPFSKYSQLQLRSNAKFNFVVTNLLGRYINFRATLVAANRAIDNDQVQEICDDLWIQIESLAGSNIVYIIMVLLKTDAKNYPLDVVLYKLFEKAHLVMLRNQYSRLPFPRTLTIILTVLFYRHWMQMCTYERDLIKHKRYAKTAINSLFYFHLENLSETHVYFGFLRIDDRFLQSAHNGTKIA